MEEHQTDTCETCKHFVIHYVEFNGNYHPVRSGHCVYPRRKLRDKRTPACQHWRQRAGE